MHIMTLLSYYEGDNLYTSAEISQSININPSLVRVELATLKNAGLLESKEGKNGGVRLGKSARNITLGDIFMAVKGESHVLSFSKNMPDVSCKIGQQINDKLDTIFDKVDYSIVKELHNQTLEEFKNQF